MNKQVVFLLLSLALLASCQRELDWNVAPEIKATVEEEPGTRTSISVNSSGAGTIYWNQSDQIDVFFGTKKATYTSQNSSNETTATFKKSSGSVNASDVSSTNIWGLYPSNSSSTCNGSAITTTLPSTQYGVANTFDDDLFPAIAHSTTTTLQFYNVCGGIKFNMVYADIKKVTFRGNNNENIAGTVSITFTDGVPKATVTSGVKEITLTPKSGSTFTQGADYYITLLPGTLSNGFTITFTAKDGTVGTLNYTDKSVTIKRSVFSRKGNMDVYAAFGDGRQPKNVIYYTSSDGSIVQPSVSNVSSSFGADMVSDEYVGSRGIIVFDSYVAALGNYAFENNKKLSSITIPSSATYIGTQAFYSCSSLSSVSIPNSVREIGQRAFQSCWSLNSITLPSDLEKIESWAFSGCGLTSIVIPKYVYFIEYCVLSGCSNLESIVVESGNGYYDSRNNCNAIIKKSTNELISGCKNTVIPDSVTGIYDSAFFDCPGLTSIEIPSSVTSIGDGAFMYCSDLTSITINATTPPSLGDGVFNNTNNCPIFVPAESVDAYKSAWSTYASRIQAIPLNKIYYTSSNGNVITPYKTDAFGVNIVSNEYVGGRGVITFDGEVTSIGSRAFQGCTALTTIEIPESVTSLGAHAFDGCSGLTTIDIPSSVSVIPAYAFYGCSKMTSVSIPESITTVGSYAFTSCSSLKSLELPASVTSIGAGTFYGCSSMECIIIHSTSVPSIEGNAFTGAHEFPIYVPMNMVSSYRYSWNEYAVRIHPICPKNVIYYTIEGWNPVTPYDPDAFGANIVSNDYVGMYDEYTTQWALTFDGDVTSIGDWAFNGCGLNSITIPNSVTSIGDGAFYGCSYLNKITIPESVTSLGSGLFQGCYNLKSIIILSPTPPSANMGTFYFQTEMDLPSQFYYHIFVPNEAVNSYKNAPYWDQSPSDYLSWRNSDVIYPIIPFIANGFNVDSYQQNWYINLTEHTVYSVNLLDLISIHDDGGHSLFENGAWALGTGYNGIPYGYNAWEFYGFSLKRYEYDTYSLPAEQRQNIDINLDTFQFAFDYTDLETLNGVYQIYMSFSFQSMFWLDRPFTIVIIIRGEDQL